MNLPRKLVTRMPLENLRKPVDAPGSQASRDEAHRQIVRLYQKGWTIRRLVALCRKEYGLKTADTRSVWEVLVEAGVPRRGRAAHQEDKRAALVRTLRAMFAEDRTLTVLPSRDLALLVARRMGVKKCSHVSVWSARKELLSEESSSERKDEANNEEAEKT